MKEANKGVLFILTFALGVFNLAQADFMPSYTNSINHFGIGAVKVTNYITIYEEPDLNSKVLKRIYWNNIENFITDKKEESPNDIFLAYIPKENTVFLSAEDETDEWVKVCYNQKKLLFGWVKKENKGQGAKFYTYKDLFFQLGKKCGIYTFRNLPEENKKLYGAPNKDSREVDKFDYPKHISPWLIQGNWMLVKVTTYDNKTKTGWFRWRTDEGRLNGFVQLNRL